MQRGKKGSSPSPKRLWEALTVSSRQKELFLLLNWPANLLEQETAKSLGSVTADISATLPQEPVAVRGWWRVQKLEVLTAFCLREWSRNQILPFAFFFFGLLSSQRLICFWENWGSSSNTTCVLTKSFQGGMVDMDTPGSHGDSVEGVHRPPEWLAQGCAPSKWPDARAEGCQLAQS